MDLKELVTKKLMEKFPEVEFEFSDYRDQLAITLNKKLIVEVSEFIKDDQDLQFKLCEDVTAIDWARRKNRFTVVYHIMSLKLNSRIRLKADVDESDCNIDSVSSIWKTADWHERETFDMYGI